jgi:predicted nucleic acid-binding protein
MRDSPPLYVVDTNILIDLHVGGLLREVFRLPCQLMAPDVIIAELQEPDGRQLIEYGLQSGELSGAQVQEVAWLVARHRRVSTNDLFALVLARAQRATLLTGDQHLSQVAEREGVAAHGTLWVLDEMVHLKVIAPFQAAQALEQMLSRGRRLPPAECHRRLRRWRAQ